MPARNSSMELSSEPDAQSTATRRKSARVVRKPQVYAASSPAGSTKRKRDGAEESEDEEAEDDEEEPVEESEEGEPDEEELREKRRKARSRPKPPSKKPAPKKTKTNGETVSLAIRPVSKPAGSKAANKPRPKKAKPLNDGAAEEAGGLFAEVFARGHTLDDVAAQWLAEFEQHEARAIASLVNFVIRASGSDGSIDENDVADPDSAMSKLLDLQEEYQAQHITDYPLIAKGRSGVSFKTSVTGFFDSLIQTISKSGLLFTHIELMENIQVWISTMSSAANRPFRHTSTVVSLAIVSSLCEIGGDIAQDIATNLRFSEGQKKKAKAGRSRELEEKAKEQAEKQESINAIIKDWIDTVFVHRYRDVDPRIRVDCVQGLSEWIIAYPDLLLDGEHLRYLGWVLSDHHAQTRLECIRQLQRLFKDKNKLAGLKTFTERFRPRMVEMATRDMDANVRAATVELLDTLRDVGLLEPDDIDEVGRLIFDSEPKVRKAVVPFFAENVNDAYEAHVEDIGGQEALNEALNTVADEDFESPRLAWVKLKSLVEIFDNYDADGEALPSEIENWGGVTYLVAAGIESRFSTAAAALYNQMSELREWENIAGYLLFDHSQTAQNGFSDDPESLLKQVCTLNEKEEILLLEILNATVSLKLQEAREAATDKKVKKTKAQKEQLQEEQEEAARHLAAIIPRLLKKFGALPDAAASVLRLVHVLNLEVFQELREDSATLKALLDDINAQFLTHGSSRVIQEAGVALLHAKGFEQLGEVTEEKLQALWDDTMNALHTLHRDKDFRTRGSLGTNVLTGVSNTVLRIHNLSRISNNTEALEAIPAARTKQKSKSQSQQPQPGINLLIDLIYRGSPTDNLDPDKDAQEDVLVTNAANALLFYFIWKVQGIQAALIDSTQPAHSSRSIESLAMHRDTFVAVLTHVLDALHGADEVRLTVAGVLMDLHCLFSTLRYAQPKRKQGKSQEREQDSTELFKELIQPIPDRAQKTLLSVLAAAEKAYAKRLRKKLDALIDPGDEPLDPDDEPASSDEEEEGWVEKQQGVLLAEQRLCELGARMVLGVTAGVVDENWRPRLERNKGLLGSNWREVVSALEWEKKSNSRAKKGQKEKGRKGDAGKIAKSKEIVVEDDDEDEEMGEGDERLEEVDAEEDQRREEEERESRENETDVPAEDEVESVLGD
ncbi:hypothetical protein M501DRAFT_1011829 [Patellaria atrata CBS 101060]|uniref:SCD domain-containing protein n=1 Tax=Patellaria atrata CBS 101060 TaxID=1346257 RepID=A0A9P4S8V0_9PEZI|nr:hypothetical protein M501DRAFT_1011829 [Patellaria atrata CBS 101060]